MSGKKRRVVYPGTFDPLTNGHLDVIEKASHLFDEVVVAIGQNRTKNAFFSGDERRVMIEEVCQYLPNVTVGLFDGLAIEFTSSVGAIALVRGLRTEADFMYEMQMAMMNRNLNDHLETVFIPTRQDLSHVSSSLVKEVSFLGGDVSKLVPPLVSKKLAEKIAERKKSINTEV